MLYCDVIWLNWIGSERCFGRDYCYAVESLMYRSITEHLIPSRIPPSASSLRSLDTTLPLTCCLSIIFSTCSRPCSRHRHYRPGHRRPMSLEAATQPWNGCLVFKQELLRSGSSEVSPSLSRHNKETVGEHCEDGQEGFHRLWHPPTSYLVLTRCETDQGGTQA